jgi:hypothetical protein
VAVEIDGVVVWGAVAGAPAVGTAEAAAAGAEVAGWVGWDMPRAARIVKNPVTLRPANIVRLAL